MIGRPPTTNHIFERVKELHSTGLSQVQIARNCNVSQSVISRLCRINGLEPNRYKAPKGDKAPGWKGGKSKNEGGYILVSDKTFPSMLNMTGYVLEHRLNMAKYLNRPLESWETVHHIDGDIENNDVSNLQLRIGKHGKHIVYACADCGSENIYPTKLK